jgi:hypothetical protein
MPPLPLHLFSATSNLSSGETDGKPKVSVHPYTRLLVSTLGNVQAEFTSPHNRIGTVGRAF